MEIFERLENHERSNLLAENIFEKLSDQDLLDLKKKFEAAVENCPSELFNTVLPESYWRHRARRLCHATTCSFQSYCSELEREKEIMSLCWNSIDFN